MGMAAENAQRKHRGESMAYIEDDFLKVIDQEGIDHDIITRYIDSKFN